MSEAENVYVNSSNFSANAGKAFSQLWGIEDFSDVTLATKDRRQIKAHKIVLSSSSSFFRDVLIYQMYWLETFTQTHCCIWKTLCTIIWNFCWSLSTKVSARWRRRCWSSFWTWESSWRWKALSRIRRQRWTLLSKKIKLQSRKRRQKTSRYSQIRMKFQTHRWRTQATWWAAVFAVTNFQREGF